MEYPKVVNIKKEHLKKRGINSFNEWKQNEKHLYVGRNMDFYVKGACGSKWENPYNIKQYDRSLCLELYESYIRNTPELYNSLDELLSYKELGCWCKPEACHGDVLIKLLNEKEGLKIKENVGSI